MGQDLFTYEKLNSMDYLLTKEKWKVNMNQMLIIRMYFKSN